MPVTLPELFHLATSLPWANLIVNEDWFRPIHCQSFLFQGAEPVINGWLFKKYHMISFPNSNSNPGDVTTFTVAFFERVFPLYVTNTNRQCISADIPTYFSHVIQLCMLALSGNKRKWLVETRALIMNAIRTLWKCSLKVTLFWYPEWHQV